MEKTFEEKFGLNTEEIENILGGQVEKAVANSMCDLSCIACTDCIGCASQCGVCWVSVL